MPVDALLGRLSDIEGRVKEIQGKLEHRPQDLPEGEQAATALAAKILSRMTPGA